MVYYFSGTGNSTFVAVTISNFLGMKNSFIPTLNPKEERCPDEKIIFVFPVYSWGVPPLVTKFIEDLGEDFWNEAISKGHGVHCVMTCGDEVALAPEMLQKTFRKFGVEPDSIRSVIMPNNYVLLPGFDVDPKTLEDEKLKNSEGRIMEIATGISRGDKTIDVTRGNIPWLKSKIVFPLFKKWGIFPKQWHYTSSCISCGRCASICPMLNVVMEPESESKGEAKEIQHPKWGLRCCSCLACYHVCPVHAVEYGKETKKKGQYLFPLRKISLRNCHK